MLSWEGGTTRIPCRCDVRNDRRNTCLPAWLAFSIACPYSADCTPAGAVPDYRLT